MMPALADIGAVRALADRVQIKGTRQTLQIVVVFTHRRARLEPLRLGLGHRPRRFDLHQLHHFSIVAAGKVAKLKGKSEAGVLVESSVRERWNFV
jgi:hypothetical protein